MAEEQGKDRLTKAHQWITVVAVPMGLAVAGWIAVTFDHMRFDVSDLKASLGFVKETIGQHSTELQNIETEIKSISQK